MADMFPKMIKKNHKLTDGKCTTNSKQKNYNKQHQAIIESIFCKTLIKRKTPTHIHSKQKKIGKNVNIFYQKLCKDDNSWQTSEMY